MKAADQKIFDAILSGKFNIQDKAAFEARLASDSEFKQDWELYQSMDDFVGVQLANENSLATLRNVHAAQKSALAGTAQSTPLVENSEKSKTPVSKIVEFKSSRRPWMVAASTIILLGLASYFALFTSPGLSGYAESYEAPNWPIERGEASEKSKLIAAFLAAPDQSKINDFHQLDSIFVSEKNYWLAEMHLQTGEADSCLHYLNLAQDYRLKKDRLRFLEALAYLKTKNVTALEALLESLPSDFDPYYRQKIEAFCD